MEGGGGHPPMENYTDFFNEYFPTIYWIWKQKLLASSENLVEKKQYHQYYQYYQFYQYYQLHQLYQFWLTLPIKVNFANNDKLVSKANLHLISFPIWYMYFNTKYSIITIQKHCYENKFRLSWKFGWTWMSLCSMFVDKRLFGKIFQ